MFALRILDKYFQVCQHLSFKVPSKDQVDDLLDQMKSHIAAAGFKALGLAQGMAWHGLAWLGMVRKSISKLLVKCSCQIFTVWEVSLLLCYHHITLYLSLLSLLALIIEHFLQNLEDPSCLLVSLQSCHVEASILQPGCWYTADGWQ